MSEEGFHEFVVSPEEAGLRLDVLLGRKFPRAGRSDWQGRIRDGRARIGGRTVRPARRVQPGELVSFSFHKKPEPPVSSDIRFAFVDEHAFVIDKPANLPVHPSGIYHRNTLSELLKQRFGNDFQARFVSRLDRETSGLMILGRSREDARQLAAAQRRGEIRKEYSVLVEGTFPEYLDAVGFLGPDPASEVRKKRRFYPDADAPMSGRRHVDSEQTSDTLGWESARTEFYLEKIHGGLSLLRARLHTGRMHQIRATLVSLGFPVTGDRLYGLDDSMYLRFIHGTGTQKDAELLRLGRTALHSTFVEFPHPASGEVVSVRSPLPGDMESLLK